jgi:hypothetical protein
MIPSWQNTFFSRHSRWALGDYLAAVRCARYPFYEWNGWIFRSEDFPDEDKRVCLAEKVPNIYADLSNA